MHAGICPYPPTSYLLIRLPKFVIPTAIWSSGSSLKTSAKILIRFWMPSCELYHIKTPEFDVNEGLRIVLPKPDPNSARLRPRVF